MEYTKLGNSGMDVSRICLGCMGFGDAGRGVHKWVLNEESSQPIIKKALELGINFFDTANVYASGVPRHGFSWERGMFRDALFRGNWRVDYGVI